MPYASMEDVNPAIKGIDPPVTLAQANLIADWADKIEDVESPWAVAIANFKKAYVVEDGKWVKRVEEVDMELGEAVTKSVSGKDLPASSFLVVGDAEEVGTWALPVKDAAGKADHGRMGGAWAALHGGYRGQKYEGPGKAAAITKLRALYKAEDMVIPGVAELGEQEDVEREAKMAAPLHASSFSDVDAAAKAQETMDKLRVRMGQFNALMDNLMWSEEVKDKATAIRALTEEFVGLLPASLKTTTELEPEEMESDLEITNLAETYAGIELLTVGIAEADNQGPLTMKIRPIRPGFGNAKHKNHYSAAMLKREAHRLVGVKMYESDHKNDKSTRTWVSTTTELLGFDQMGAPILEVVVHDPNFAQRIRNLNEAELLDKMECSIFGSAKGKRNQMVEGRKVTIIEALTNIRSIDWVTKAGAGGMALSIAESDKDGNMDEKDPKVTEAPKEETPKVETPKKDAEPQGQVLEAVSVLKALLTSGLPQAAQERLAEAEYADEGTLTAAIDAEKAYLKAARPSEGGRPFGMGSAEPKREEDEKPLAERETAIVNKYIGR